VTKNIFCITIINTTLNYDSLFSNKIFFRAREKPDIKSRLNIKILTLKGNEVRSNPETCEATFLKSNPYYGSVLDIGNLGRSGYIDMHDYPGRANCFIEVVADSTCTEITAKVIHAAIEEDIYDGCDDYNHYYDDYDVCCPYDKFWFNDEDHHSCGCQGNNLEFGDGCNDHLVIWPNNDDNYDPNRFKDMNGEAGRHLHDRIFNTNSFKFNFVTDYSVAKGNLRIEWCCSSNGVCPKAPSAPSDPKDRLDQLVRFSGEVLDNFFADHKRINNWKKKFATNAGRMKKSYQRCGEDPVVDAEEEWAAYDDTNGAKAMSDLTTGFRKWAETYLSGCSGHKREKHHVKRMNKWNQKFQN